MVWTKNKKMKELIEKHNSADEKDKMRIRAEMSPFDLKLKSALLDFRNDAISSIKEGPRKVPRSEGNNTANVTFGTNNGSKTRLF